MPAKKLVYFEEKVEIPPLDTINGINLNQNVKNFSHSHMKLLENNENLLSIYSNVFHSDSTNYNKSLLKKDRVPFYKIITHSFYKANKIFHAKGGKYAS